MGKLITNWNTMSCDIFTFVVFGVLIGVTSLTGMVGNTISFLVISRMHQNPTFIVLRFICVSDNLYLSVSFLIRSMPYFSHDFNCTVSSILNKWVWPLATLGTHSAAWMTVLLSIYRFVVVKMPTIQ